MKHKFLLQKIGFTLAVIIFWFSFIRFAIYLSKLGQ